MKNACIEIISLNVKNIFVFLKKEKSIDVINKYIRIVFTQRASNKTQKKREKKPVKKKKSLEIKMKHIIIIY
jgi:hypothetical protein